MGPIVIEPAVSLAEAQEKVSEEGIREDEYGG
jgi:hypothetical protein